MKEVNLQVIEKAYLQGELTLQQYLQLCMEWSFYENLLMDVAEIKEKLDNIEKILKK